MSQVGWGYVPREGVGGGGTLYDDLYGEAPPERGSFFRLQVYERVRKGNLSFGSMKWPKGPNK